MLGYFTVRCTDVSLSCDSAFGEFARVATLPASGVDVNITTGIAPMKAFSNSWFWGLGGTKPCAKIPEEFVTPNGIGLRPGLATGIARTTLAATLRCNFLLVERTGTAKTKTSFRIRCAAGIF